MEFYICPYPRPLIPDTFAMTKALESHLHPSFVELVVGTQAVSMKTRGVFVA